MIFVFRNSPEGREPARGQDYHRMRFSRNAPGGQEKSSMWNQQFYMSSHEAMCEERWKTCFNRLYDLDDSIKRLESILIAAAGGALVGGLGVLATILTMHL